MVPFACSDHLQLLPPVDSQKGIAPHHLVPMKSQTIEVAVSWHPPQVVHPNAAAVTLSHGFALATALPKLT